MFFSKKKFLFLFLFIFFIFGSVNSLKNGIDEVVGEKGVKISGGQKQRIGIARAIYNNCQILILDESTSSLDQETESNILNNIKIMKKNLTIIIISHKPSIMEICDKAYYLDSERQKNLLVF